MKNSKFKIQNLKVGINKRNLFNLALILLITIMFVLFIKSNLQYARKVFEIKFQLLFIIIVLNLVSRFLVGLKIKRIVKLFDISLSAGEWIGSSAVLNLYNQIFSKTGDVVVANYLKRLHKLNYSKYLSLMVGDGIISLFVSSMVGLVCAFYGSMIFVFKGLIMPYSFLLLAIVCLFVILMPEVKLPGHGAVREKINNMLHGWNLLRKNFKTVLILMILNLLLVIIFAVRFYIIFRVFSNSIPFFVCLVVSPLSIITQAVSVIPGAYGLREVVAGFTTKLADLGFTLGTMAVFVDRLIMICVAFVTGSIFHYVLFREKRPETVRAPVAKKGL